MEIADLNCTYPDDFDEMSGANLNFRHSNFKSFERENQNCQKVHMNQTIKMFKRAKISAKIMKQKERICFLSFL